jgi:hypothetical protein
MNKNFKAKTTEGESTPQHKKDYMNICLLQPGFQATASLWLNNMLEWSTISFHAGIAKEMLLGPYMLPPLGLFSTISYETSFQSLSKVWICRLGFVYGSCMMLLKHIFFLQLEHP